MYREFTQSRTTGLPVAAYWIHETQSGAPATTVLPDGCSDIILSFNGGNAEQYAIGCMTGPIAVHPEPGVTMIGIRFLPGHAAAFLGIPADALTDRMIPLNDIRRIDLSGIDPDILRNNPESLAGTIEERLLHAGAARRADARAQLAVSRFINHRGSLSVETAAEALGLTRRHLERLFLAEVGVTPKRFARIMRFRHARRVITAHPARSLTDIALEAGYYDQAHLYREFREFSGAAPGK